MITLQIVLRELESDLLPGQLLVDGREGVGLMFNVGLLGFVKMNLEHKIRLTVLKTNVYIIQRLQIFYLFSSEWP